MIGCENKNRLSNLALLICLVATTLAFAVPASAQDNPKPKTRAVQRPPREADTKRDTARMAAAYQRGWQREKQILTRLCELDEATAGELTKQLNDQFNDLAKAQLKSNPRALNDAVPIGVPAELQAVISAALKETLPAERLQVYQRDLEQRSQYIRNSVIVAMKVVLQDLLALDADQLKQVEPLLEKHYSPTWYLYVQGFGTPEFEEDADKAITAILTEKQAVAWRLKSGSQLRMAIQPPGSTVAASAEKNQHESFRKSLAAIVDARLEMLTRVLKLDEKQVRKLNVLARGVQSEIVEKRVDARREMQAGFGLANRIPDPRVIEYANGVPSTLLAHEPKWVSYVEKVLNDDQRKQYAELAKSRVSLGKSHMSKIMTVSLSGRLSLSGNQMRDLSTLMEERLPDQRFTRLSPAFIRAIVNLPEAQVKAILDEKSLVFWNQQMDDGRQMLEQLEAAE